MKTRVILLYLLLSVHFQGWGQFSDFLIPDTLKFHHRTGGRIDTFDLAYSFPYTTMPSTGFSNRFQTPTIDFFSTNSRLISFDFPSLLDKKVISALPHIGFGYSFGAKGMQYLHADFQQSLRKNTLINASIDRHSAGDASSRVVFAQNSYYEYNVIRIGLYRDYKRFNLSLRASYSGDERGLNNGIHDSLTPVIDAANLGLEFTPVQNSTLGSVQKGINSKLSLQYNLLNDSSNTRIGPMISSQFTLRNRILEDQLDSLRDQYQDARIENGVGAFISNKVFSLNGRIAHRYWRFQNSGTNSDTNEVNFRGNFLLVKNNYAFEANFYQNIIGAKQELDFKSRFRIGDKRKGATAFLNFSDLLPTPLQRGYFGKNINYNNTPLTKQKILRAGVGANYTFGKLDIHANAGIWNSQNNLIWKDSIWKIGDASNLNLVYFKVNAHLDLGLFQWYPGLVLQSGSEYLPQFIFSGRLLLKKKVFEAKKLELQFSVDPQINSTYKLLSYNTTLDNFYLNSTNRSGGQPYSLHSTFSLGIEEFRFFVRGENIQSFWMKGSTEVLQNYYLSPFVLRLGLSWDFFN